MRIIIINLPIIKEGNKSVANNICCQTSVCVHLMGIDSQFYVGIVNVCHCKRLWHAKD